MSQPYFYDAVTRPNSNEPGRLKPPVMAVSLGYDFEKSTQTRGFARLQSINIGFETFHKSLILANRPTRYLLFGHDFLDHGFVEIVNCHSGINHNGLGCNARRPRA